MEFETSDYMDEPTMSRKEFEKFIEHYNLPVFCFNKRGEFVRHTLYQGFVIREKQN